MLPSERHKVVNSGGLLLDGGEACWNIAERNAKIADVRQHQFRYIYPLGRMRAIDKHSARLANGLGSEASAAAVGCADIERDAGDRDRRIVPAPPGSEETGGNGKGRRIARHSVKPPSNFLPRSLKRRR